MTRRRRSKDQTEVEQPNTDEPAPKRDRRSVRLIARTIWLLAVTAVLIGLLFVAVFPTRAFLDQRAEIDQTADDIELARARIETLEARIDDFNDRVAVARIARERFSLVFEGEELFRLSARPSEAVDLPPAWMWPGFERIVRDR